MYMISDAYSSAKVWNCKGCQDGLWVHNMALHKGWVVHRPAVSGLQTMVFHGPSPLWCVAAGHVWYDRPDHYACLDHKALGRLHHNPDYDWEHYHAPRGLRICLRLSELGYKNKDNRTTIIT